jgi:hypothetical protein
MMVEVRLCDVLWRFVICDGEWRRKGQVRSTDVESSRIPLRIRQYSWYVASGTRSERHSKFQNEKEACYVLKQLAFCVSLSVQCGAVKKYAPHIFTQTTNVHLSIRQRHDDCQNSKTCEAVKPRSVCDEAVRFPSIAAVQQRIHRLRPLVNTSFTDSFQLITNNHHHARGKNHLQSCGVIEMGERITRNKQYRKRQQKQQMAPSQNPPQ